MTHFAEGTPVINLYMTVFRQIKISRSLECWKKTRIEYSLKTGTYLTSNLQTSGSSSTHNKTPKQQNISGIEDALVGELPQISRTPKHMIFIVL
jgi:hypothetical protein